ncbi:MAG: hypothetical protein QOG72_2975 [Sphingomonadales bacterium]|nr:hypothetical protein [Sphingomonadales bacterium]
MKSLIIAALLAATPAEPAQRPCLSQAQIEDLTLFALPPLLEAAATKCAPVLPADAYLANGGRELARSLAAGSKDRWARASAALAVIAKDKFPSGLSESTARGLIHDLALNDLLKQTTPLQCGRINRAADLLSPLPSANLAGLAVMAVEIASEDGKAKQRPFVCPAPRP